MTQCNNCLVATMDYGTLCNMHTVYTPKPTYTVRVTLEQILRLAADKASEVIKRRASKRGTPHGFDDALAVKNAILALKDKVSL